MTINEAYVQVIDGKKVISASLLEKMLDERDYSIQRIKHATEMRKKQRLAQNVDIIDYPEEFQKYGTLADAFMEPYVSGFTIDNDGSVRCHYGAMGAPFSVVSPLIYRGEITDYGNSSGYSTLGRKIAFGDDKQPETRYIHFFREQIRKIMFLGFLTFFRQFHEFPFGEPLDGALAQHYGLDTQFIDFTDDIKVALFFASCRHIEKNRYRPIKKDDIKELGAYGVLFCGRNNLAKIIGYQPFCRCHRQRGYYIDSSAVYPCWDYNLSEDQGFSKYYFERTPELSQRIFTEFEEGRYLFPEDDLSPFWDVIEQIKNTNHIPITAFNHAYTVCKLYFEEYKRNNFISEDLFAILLDKQRIMNKLQSDGLVLCDQLSISVDKSHLNRINEKWDPERYAKGEGLEFSPWWVIKDK